MGFKYDSCCRMWPTSMIAFVPVLCHGVDVSPGILLLLEFSCDAGSVVLSSSTWGPLYSLPAVMPCNLEFGLAIARSASEIASTQAYVEAFRELSYHTA